MPRDYKVFLQDVLDAIANVAEFVGAMTLDEFKSDKKTLHAVVRNLEVIGEAVKGVPPEVRQPHPEVPWQRIAGLRGILIHHYFKIDIVWDIVQNKLPELKQHFQTTAVRNGCYRSRPAQLAGRRELASRALRPRAAAQRWANTRETRYLTRTQCTI